MKVAERATPAPCVTRAARSDEASAVAAAERIRARIEAVDMKTADAAVHLRAGFGVAAYPVTATTVDDLLRAADAALYVAKRGGGNRVAAAPALLQP